MENIHNKCRNISETRYDTDKEIVESLANLSIFFSNNTLNTRRTLRSQIEKKGLELHKNFLNEYDCLKVALDGICENLQSMKNSIDNLRTCLEKTQVQTHELINRTGVLKNENDNLKLKQTISIAFVNHFQLNQNDYQILYGTKRDEAITKDFFRVLDRVQSISKECKLLLLQTGYENLALDIMEQMTLHYEGALERLYRWTQIHCRGAINTSSETGILVTQAVSKLQDRPVLLNYVIQEYATNRRSILAKMLIDALTVGENARPIEMHIHDPKRYTGDLFAWLHQAIPTERENLLMLCKLCDKNDICDILNQALANICDGVCHTLKVRIEMVLNAEKDCILLYSISNLIKFYCNILSQMVKGSNLDICLQELVALSEVTFMNSLSMHVKDILLSDTFQIQNSLDLQPPACVGKLLNMLKEILSVANMVEGRQTDISKIVSFVIDPLLKSITESAIHLHAQDMSVYLLNCLYQIQSTLAMYEFTNEFMERLNGQCEAQNDSLTAAQVSSLVANLNLGPIYTVLQSNSDALDFNHLKDFMNKLDSFIDMPDVLILPQLNLLHSSAQRTTIQKRSFNVLIAIYTQLYEKVHEIKNPNIDPETLFNKTPTQVAELLTLQP